MHSHKIVRELTNTHTYRTLQAHHSPVHAPTFNKTHEDIIAVKLDLHKTVAQIKC